MNTHKALGLVVAAALLAACNSAESDWKKADAQNTVAGFQQFLTEHPSGPHTQQAQDRVHALQDDALWADTQKTDTLEAYQQYLQKMPNAMHTEEAQAKISSLQRAADWKVAQSAGTEQALNDFLQKYKEGPEVDEAHAKLKELSEDYRVRLASFHSQQQADKSRERLQSRFGTQLHGLVVLPPSATEKLTTVTSAPMKQQDADAACAKLKKEHQHCEVVKA